MRDGHSIHCHCEWCEPDYETVYVTDPHGYQVARFRDRPEAGPVTLAAAPAKVERFHIAEVENVDGEVVEWIVTDSMNEYDPTSCDSEEDARDEVEALEQAVAK